MCHLRGFFKSIFPKNSAMRVLNSLESDHTRCSVGPDLVPICPKSYQRTTLGDKELVILRNMHECLNEIKYSAKTHFEIM